MSTNFHAPGNNSSLEQFINAACAAGSIGSLTYPDQSIMQYVKAAIANNGGQGIPGAPSLEVAQMVIAALGA
jgi:hypothetical protein